MDLMEQSHGELFRALSSDHFNTQVAISLQLQISLSKAWNYFRYFPLANFLPVVSSFVIFQFDVLYQERILGAKNDHPKNEEEFLPMKHQVNDHQRG